MLANERGTCSGSDLYFQTPSDYAKQILYYMTSCGYYYTDYGYKIERYDYHNYMLAYIIDGRLSVTSNQNTVVASKGQIVLLNCHLPHEYHTIGNTEFIWLHFDGCNSNSLYKAIISQYNNFVFSLNCACNIEKEIYEIIYTYRNSKLLTEAKISFKIYSLLMELLDNSASCDESNEFSKTVHSAVDFVNKNYKNQISLIDISNAVSMSQYHFSRIFKKECGYSPHEFLMITRINNAKHLLKTTDLAVKVIAQDVGYQNATTFTNAFSERVGVSPSQFRKYPV